MASYDDVRAKYDAIVVGSGAGGGVAAALCASAGMSVLVLEAGPPQPRLDAVVSWTVDRSISILTGACVGGGTGLQWSADGTTPAQTQSYLRDAVENGAHLVADARVENAHLDGSGRVHGVNVYFMVEGEPRRRTIVTRRAIVAAGALRTPGVLAASGVQNPHLGRHLRLHPSVAVMADGQPEALVSICDSGEGWVSTAEVPQVTYTLSRADAKALRVATQALPKVGRSGVFSTHQMGTARMHRDPAQGVVDADGHVHGHPNLFVADASVFADASGVNPMQTVMALAHRTVNRLILNG